MDTMTLAERLASYATALEYDHLPGEVVHEVKRRVIDALGCALGGYDGQPCRAAREVAAGIGAEKGATILGTAKKTSPELAAFANGIMVRYLDYNDTYLSKEPAHPSDNIPAALAVAEAMHRDGRELIAAIVVAYEVQCRLCDGASLRARGWDHVTYGAFSTSLAAAKLLWLDESRTANAVALAGVANIALRQTRVGELSMWKGCAFANAARNGVFAARLAMAGMTGPREVFEGPCGFIKLVSGPLELEPFGGDGRRFKILDTSIKYHPAEYHSQAAIEAALALREGIDPEDIEAVEVRAFDAAVDIIADPEKWQPRSRETADHSLPYIVAAALMDGEITERQFAEERMRDPALRALVQKVKVHRDPELTRGNPGAIPTVVEVVAKGKKMSKRVDYPRGHARNPMSDKEVEAKFRMLSRTRLSEERMERVLESIWRLEEVGDVGELFPLLAVGP
ncbi:MAG: MmgE/PrpD family protein [Candidatus Hydrothermarchaeota archaeon]